MNVSALLVLPETAVAPDFLLKLANGQVCSIVFNCNVVPILAAVLI